MSRLLATGVALLLALALVSCDDGDPEPQFAPADSTSPAPTEPTTVSPFTTEPTTEPPAALSPEETVRAWVEALNELLNSGEAMGFRRLSSKSCSACEQLASSITETYDKGGSARTDGWSISRLKRRPDFADNHQVVASVDSARGVTISEAGADPQDEPADKFIIQLAVERVAGIWSVSELVFLS